MSFGAPNANQGRNPTKVRSRTFPGDSTSLEGRALTDGGGIVFKWIRCALEVLTVEKMGEFEFELSLEKGPAPTLVRTAIVMAVPTQFTLFECGTTA